MITEMPGIVSDMHGRMIFMARISSPGMNMENWIIF